MMIRVTRITDIPRFDAEGVAKEIIYNHTNAYTCGNPVEYPNNRVMMEHMCEDCAYVLTDYLLEGKLSPLQYAAVRNELGKMIWKIFEPHIKAEYEAEHLALLAALLG